MDIKLQEIINVNAKGAKTQSLFLLFSVSPCLCVQKNSLRPLR